MSNRTVVELNHDFCPTDDQLLNWANKMRSYMHSGDKKELPNGVTFDHIRHHSDPDPMLALVASVIEKRVRRCRNILKGETSRREFHVDRLGALQDIVDDLMAAFASKPPLAGFSPAKFRKACGFPI